jgi:hypothetical protein
MNNTFFDAWISLENLNEAIFRALGSSEKLSLGREDRDVLYNTDQAGLVELLEFSIQKEHEFRVEFWERIWNVARAPSWFQEVFRKIFLNSFEKNAISAEDLAVQLEAVKGVIESGLLPTTVSHSQGNLFANSIYRLLDKKERKKFAISAVATPANRVEGAGPYVTLDSDGVIIYLAKSFHPSPLPANTSNSSPPPGLFDHNFVEHYLRGVPTGKTLTDNTISQMKKLAEANTEDTKTSPDSECVTWFQEGKAPKEKDFFSCHEQCQIGLTGMADYFCPSQCDRLCGCESYGQSNSL